MTKQCLQGRAERVGHRKSAEFNTSWASGDLCRPPASRLPLFTAGMGNPGSLEPGAQGVEPFYFVKSRKFWYDQEQQLCFPGSVCPAPWLLKQNANQSRILGIPRREFDSYRVCCVYRASTQPKKLSQKSKNPLIVTKITRQMLIYKNSSWKSLKNNKWVIFFFTHW